MSGARPPAYVSRETGAAELDMSVDTWDAMVKLGKLPKPIGCGIAGTTPRWRWADVDEALSGKRDNEANSNPEPFFRGLANGKTKDRRLAHYLHSTANWLRPSPEPEPTSA